MARLVEMRKPCPRDGCDVPVRFVGLEGICATVYHGEDIVAAATTRGLPAVLAGLKARELANAAATLIMQRHDAGDFTYSDPDA